MVWRFFGNIQPKTQLHECRFCAGNQKSTEVIETASADSRFSVAVYIVMIIT